MQLTDLKPAPYNPRKVDDQALAGLARSIEEFGDISGIVWNRRTGHLVTGHQRLAALRAEHGDRLSVRGSDADGWALVVPGGEVIPIRIVDWDENRERAANVTANNPHIHRGRGTIQAWRSCWSTSRRPSSESFTPACGWMSSSAITWAAD